MIKSNDLVRLIRDYLPDAIVEVEDLRGNGEHYAAYIESDCFDGISLVEQHRLVYRALHGHLGSTLRSVTLKTAVPVHQQRAAG